MEVDFQGLYEQKRLNLLEVDEVNYIIKENGLDTNKVSDGYHTFGELYEHRIVLYIAFCKLAERDNKLIWRSRKHSDGSEWDGWFLLGIGEKEGKQITYHLPTSYWDQCEFAYTKDKAPAFDGHTSADVLSRIASL